MVDIHQTALERGIKTISDSLERLIKKDKISASDKSAALAKIQGSTNYVDFAHCQIVIEAATENKDLKVKILQQLQEVVSPDVIIASNTSSISITELAAQIKYPERFIGMHFFNPVPLMALVEIIRGLQTSDATHAAVQNMARALGKEPITVKNAPDWSYRLYSLHEIEDSLVFVRDEKGIFKIPKIFTEETISALFKKPSYLIS